MENSMPQESYWTKQFVIELKNVFLKKVVILNVCLSQRKVKSDNTTRKDCHIMTLFISVIFYLLLLTF